MMPLRVLQMLLPFGSLGGRLFLMTTALGLGGCGQVTALLAGETWPPRAAVLPISATAARDAGQAWDGTDAIAVEPQKLIARNIAEWQGLWSLAGQSSPRDLPDGWTGVGVFLGTANGGTRVATTDVLVTPPRTLLEQPKATVRYVALRVGVPVAAPGAVRSQLSPWAIRMVPVPADAPVLVEEQTAPSALPPVPIPEVTDRSLSEGVAWEGRSSKMLPAGSFVVRNEAEWARMWRILGRPIPRSLPADSAAVMIVSLRQPGPGWRLFTGELGIEQDAVLETKPVKRLGTLATLQYALNPPPASVPLADDARQPWAVRLIPGSATAVDLVDLVAANEQPSLAVQPVSWIIRGGRQAPRVRVVQSLPPAPP